MNNNKYSHKNKQITNNYKDANTVYYPPEEKKICKSHVRTNNG